MKVKNKSPWALALNDAPEENKNLNTFQVDKNAISDDGEGVLKFKGGLTITDDTEQHSGSRYDMNSYSIKDYNGQLTADHDSTIQSLIGTVIGTKKRDNKVTIDGIKFAVKENPLALYAYNMIVAGFLTDFSTETIGPWPDDDGVFHDARLVGLSVVVVGNNKSARINEVALNSVEEAEKLGLDTAELREKLKLPIDNKTPILENIHMFKTVKNTRDFDIEVTFKNASGEEQKVKLSPNASVDVSAEQEETVKNQISTAQKPEVDVAALVANAVKEATAPLLSKIEEVEKNAFDKNAAAPEFTKSGEAGKETTKYAEMGYKARHGLQINAAWDMLKGGRKEAAATLEEINKVNLEALKKEGKVENSITITDMGNFVISPELLTDIEGHRSNFQPLLSKFAFQNTLSLQMAWLKRDGDINMQEVEFCDDGADGNLKPISEYGATINQSNLMELAAVTPVCNAATRFLAVDLLGDVASGYRTDFDRKRAQLVIARLQQAVNASGNEIIYNTAAASVLNPLFSLIDAATSVAENIDSGVWIFNTKTYWELTRRRMAAGNNQDGAYPLFTTGDAGPLFLGSPYIVVPNELMPTLNTAETKTFVVEGANVTITEAIFYADPATWSGRTSGGLNYDLSTDAAYETVSGETTTVKSAFQRNELVLRGSFFRGGAIRDEDKVAGVKAPGVS